MIRGFGFPLFVLAIASSTGCSDAKCGPGTQRSMTAAGDVECVAVTVGAGTTECDGDAGVGLIDGNRCVATIQCGPGTKLDVASQKCLAVAQAMHEPPVCATPAAGHICANGALRHLVDGSFLSSGESVTVTFYDAPNFFNNPTPAPLAEVTGITDTYMLATIPTPQYLVAVTHDASGSMYQPTAIALTAGMDGQSLRLDAYVVTKAQYTAWALPATVESQGPLFYRFFNDPSPPANARTPTETHPVAGVTLKNGTATDPNAHYFGSSLAAIDAAATSTGASGAVITSTASTVGTFSGAGGGHTWEAHMGLAIPNILQVDFLHPTP